jgi:hypothetical protein
LSNQYLTIRFIKKEDILEEIEISEEKELFPYQEKLITLKEVKYVNPKEVSQRKEIKFFLDDVLIKTYQENFNEIDFFKFLKSLDLDVSDCRFRTNTKFDKKYMENIKSTILVKNLHIKINKINSEIEEDMSFF